MRCQMARYGHSVTWPLDRRLVKTSEYSDLGVATHLHITEWGKLPVLRITTCINSDATRFIVEGKLAGACVGELEKCWSDIVARKSAESILIDLSSVTFVDAAGKQLLSGMHKRGARFTAAGLLAKCLVEELEHSGGKE
jgi:hypothetical protein